MPPTIWTVGHSTREAGAFVALLQAYDIELVADLRRHPAFRAYADHVATEAFATGLFELLMLAPRLRTVVMCAEVLWWRCTMRRRDTISPGGSVSLESAAASGRSEHRHGPAAWYALVGWIALSGVAGAAGAIASLNARDFYASLVRPGWAPPGWVFGPVWSVLYLLMGIAAWLVWRERPAGTAESAARNRGLQLFVAQLVPNALWTWLFFAWRRGALAFAEILILWLAIAATMWLFARVHRVASWCLVPYLAWVTFATALTWAMWQGNPGRL